jgi:hypothetical protein
MGSALVASAENGSAQQTSRKKYFTNCIQKKPRVLTVTCQDAGLGSVARSRQLRAAGALR